MAASSNAGVKRPVTPIASALVRLRLLEQNDLPLTLAWRNRDDVRQSFFNTGVIQPEQHQAWFDAYRDRPDDIVLIIEDVTRKSQPVGQVSLYRIDTAAGTAEFGRLMIGEPEARGRGLGAEATALAMRLAFEQLDLRQLTLEVAATNARAIGIYESCGFHESHRHGNVVTMLAARGGRTR